ncbi:MAG TPA: hypothetical protein VHO06_12695 [Polyangia bacterium]|nr:hypothetical protein [Polyangia bacterium]
MQPSLRPAVAGAPSAPRRPIVLGLVLLGLTAATLGAAGTARAADQKAALAKVKAHYQAAAAAYDDGKFERTETELKLAVKLAEQSGLGEHKLVAQSYVLYGVLEVAGLGDTPQGVKYFAKAIDISPAIQVPPTMASKAVLAAFEEAENRAGETAAEAPPREAEAEPRPAEPAKPAPPARGDPDRDKLVEALAVAAKTTESLQQADKQIADLKLRVHDLERDKQERDGQLAELKARLQALDKLTHDRSETDKQLADERRNLQDLAGQKADADRQLAAARDDARREREARERLERAKADADKQLADERRNLQDLARQKADADKQLAAARDDARREREDKEKLAAARREADAREADRKNKELQDRTAREKLVDGPDLPSHIREPIACTVPDEVPSGTDLYVHCVPRPSIDAKVVALYYRAGGVLYNVSTMERSKKGWYTAIIPGGKIAGKVLHYYVEARDGRQGVVGSNGRANSPNVATIRPGKR